MTDREIDELLRADGARWQASQQPPPEPDVERLRAATADHRPARRWQPLAAAAAVMLLAGGAVTVASLRGSAPATAPEGEIPAAGGRSDALVRDGDIVVGQGEVVALPGRPVQLCAPRNLAWADIPIPPPPDPCAVAVTVTGIDLRRLSQRQERGGAVWGLAQVQGVYRAGTLTVTRQAGYVPAPRVDPGRPDRVPCAEPAGGWPRQPEAPVLQPALGRLQDLIGRQPTVFNEVWVAYPYGWHLQDRSSRKGTEVYVVGTVGDVAAARRRLAEVFPAAHLCVAAVGWSRATMRAAEVQLSGMDASQAGVSMPFRDVRGDRVVADILVLNEATRAYLATVASGRVVAEPMLRRATR